MLLNYSTPMLNRSGEEYIGATHSSGAAGSYVSADYSKFA